MNNVQKNYFQCQPPGLKSNFDRRVLSLLWISNKRIAVFKFGFFVENYFAAVKSVLMNVWFFLAALEKKRWFEKWNNGWKFSLHFYTSKYFAYNFFLANIWTINDMQEKDKFTFFKNRVLRFNCILQALLTVKICSKMQSSLSKYTLK